MPRRGVRVCPTLGGVKSATATSASFFSSCWEERRAYYIYVRICDSSSWFIWSSPSPAGSFSVGEGARLARTSRDLHTRKLQSHGGIRSAARRSSSGAPPGSRRSSGECCSAEALQSVAVLSGTISRLVLSPAFAPRAHQQHSTHVNGLLALGPPQTWFWTTR